MNNENMNYSLDRLAVQGDRINPAVIPDDVTCTM